MDYPTNEESLNELKALATQGNAEAAHIVGCVYRDGYFGDPDWDEAFVWIKISAEQGFIEAQFDLGQMYDMDSDNVMELTFAEKNVKAAIHGNAQAQLRRDQLFCLDRAGIPRDYTKALYWYQKAADQGYAQAQLRLGQLYYAGGVDMPTDYTKALYWYQKAADQGDGQAQFLLGQMYFEGNGVEVDENLAEKWWVKAIKNGYACAKDNLNILRIME